MATPTTDHRPSPTLDAPATAAHSVTRPASEPRGEQLQHAGEAAAIIVLLLVPVLVWMALGSWTTWGPLARGAAAVVAGVLAAMTPLFVTTYLVSRRRLMRQVEADLAARWPQRTHR